MLCTVPGYEQAHASVPYILKLPKHCPELKSISLTGNTIPFTECAAKILDQSLQNLKLPKLRSVHVGKCTHLGWCVIRTLSRFRADLEALNIEVPHFGSTDAALLGAKHLSLTATSVTMESTSDIVQGRSLKDFSQALRRVKTLHIASPLVLDDFALFGVNPEVPLFPHLEKLVVLALMADSGSVDLAVRNLLIDMPKLRSVRSKPDRYRMAERIVGTNDVFRRHIFLLEKVETALVRRVSLEIPLPDGVVENTG